MLKKVCHITTVHPRYDTRIFIKECVSLSQYYNVHLIVADGKGDEFKDGIHIHDIGLRQSSRIKRIKVDSKKAFKKALELNCEVYHFHDPELIKIGKKLISHNKMVIYDVHEDLPRQIYGKPYLKNWIKPILSKIIEWQENRAAKNFSFILTATTHIKNRFLKINDNSIAIKNYPKIGELEPTINWTDKKNEICYVGGISEVRGIKEIVKSLDYLDKIKLNLGGTFNDSSLEVEVKSYPSWEKVNFLGFINREQISNVFAKSKVGLVTLHPIINYIDALPVKMFEYMMAGIPVISSDIPLWKSIVESNQCGIVVDPYDPEKISKVIQYILDNPGKAEEMGKNGQKAVKEKYNWAFEEKKLLETYITLLSN